jgi:hypothetical protein
VLSSPVCYACGKRVEFKPALKKWFHVSQTQADHCPTKWNIRISYDTAGV